MDELSSLLLTMGSICAACLLDLSRMLSAEGEPIVSSGFPPVYGKLPLLQARGHLPCLPCMPKEGWS